MCNNLYVPTIANKDENIILLYFSLKCINCRMKCNKKVTDRLTYRQADRLTDKVIHRGAPTECI